MDYLRLGLVFMWAIVVVLGILVLYYTGAFGETRPLERAEAAPAVTDGPGPYPYEIGEGRLAQKIHRLVNEKRALADAPALGYDEGLALIAASHSADMRGQNFFEHVNPDGTDPNGRAAKHGYSCRKETAGGYREGIAENLFMGYAFDRVSYANGKESERNWLDEDEIARSAVEGWMESQEHRENMLDLKFESEGIGVVVADNYTVFVTQNFC